MMIMSLTACGAQTQETAAEEGFKPRLDTSVSCSVRIAGGYDNFEALEAEFDRFNDYYPNVELVYTKVDDYNNMIGTVLDGTMHLTSMSIIPGCMEETSIRLR